MPQVAPSSVAIGLPPAATGNDNCIVASVPLAHASTMKILEVADGKWPGFQLNISNTLISSILGLSDIQSGYGRVIFWTGGGLENAG